MNTGVGDKLGLEMEMGVVNRSSGARYAVRSFFANFAELKSSRGEKPIMTRLEGRCVGLTATAGHRGLDNGCNLLETSFAPEQRGRLQIRAGHRAARRAESCADLESSEVARTLCRYGIGGNHRA